MNYYIELKSGDSYSVASVSGRNAGNNDARRLGLSYEDCPNEVGGIYLNNAIVRVPTTTASKMDIFDISRARKVTVPSRSLDQYAIIEKEERPDGELRLNYKLDEQAILSDWLLAGAPLDWDLSEGEAL